MSELRGSQLRADPFQQFEDWFEEGRPTVKEPEAVALATAAPTGRPSLRMVLMKAYDPAGFVFATNYRSRKGEELDENPSAALLFFWPELERQVRIVGRVERAPEWESDRIFMARPRASRLAATMSRQSRPIGSRAELEALVAKAEQDLEGQEVRRPAHWGGYRVVPDEFEFWQGRRNRLHDRFVYQREATGWRIQRLQP